MKKSSRSEVEVFADLTKLARASGYIHVIAQICVRDNMVSYVKEMKGSDLQTLHSPERLIRTEVTTLLGLLASGPIDFAPPLASTIQEYVERTDRLMEELHMAMAFRMRSRVIGAVQSGEPDANIWRGEAMREPIFYGVESAYAFQYRDLATAKYGADDPWLIQNKGFSIGQAQTIATTMCSLLDKKVTHAFATIKKYSNAPGSWLSVFEQTLDEIAFRSGVSVATVQAFLDAFTLHDDNAQFQSLSDFNKLYATPLLRAANANAILMFQDYGVHGALYESPFYWLMADKSYEAKAAQNRGAFTESFTAKRLRGVFGPQHVHSNVRLAQGKGTDAGEIDVLVVFGDRLIIVQAKSKKLTLEARGGNDDKLREDFKAAIQCSYNQAWSCAQSILTGACRLMDASNKEVLLQLRPKEIFIFNVVADHYPALAFQARQFLKYQTSKEVCPPFVMDVFLLDALTEMLDTPLRLLSYAKWHAGNLERVMTTHELTALSFYLKGYLWLDPEFDMVVLEDDIATDLDLAMTVRRDNVPGSRTPAGILTRLAGTLCEQLILQIEKRPDPESIELGFLLLSLGEDTCRDIHNGLELITRQTRADGKHHDFTIVTGQEGLTFHCNPRHAEGTMRQLRTYCEHRKYAQQAGRWIGVALDAKANLQFGVVLDFEWVQSKEMDAATAHMQLAMPTSKLPELVRGLSRNKIGRNDPCTCGSGKKYKKCCLETKSDA